MAISEKETLAARRLATAVTIVQLLGFVAFALAMAQLPLQNSTSSQCIFRMFWWGIIESSEAAPATLWVYYVSRVLNWLHTVWLDLRYMWLYNAAEQVDRNSNHSGTSKSIARHLSGDATTPAPDNETKTTTLSSAAQRDTSDPEAADSPVSPEDGRSSKNVYNRTPATAFTQYLQHLPSIVTSWIGMQDMLKQFGLSETRSWSTLWTEWGQSATFVVCIASIAHWSYIQYRMSTQEAVRRRWEIEQAICGQTSPPSWAVPYKRRHGVAILGCVWQHQPFGRLSRLYIADYTRCNSEEIVWQEEQPRDIEHLSPEETAALEDELLVAQALRDRIGAIDCIRRGAPTEIRDAASGGSTKVRGSH